MAYLKIVAVSALFLGLFLPSMAAVQVWVTPSGVVVDETGNIVSIPVNMVITPTPTKTATATTIFQLRVKPPVCYHVPAKRSQPAYSYYGYAYQFGDYGAYHIPCPSK